MSDWHALERLAVAMAADGQAVTLVVGHAPRAAVVSTTETGHEARCVDSAEFEGFVGVVTSDGQRHELMLD